jgi:hypothetical protein
LGVELQALGENLNTWGDTKLNDVIKRLEEAIAGAVSIAVEANVTLTSTDYVQNQARYAMLIFTGSGGFNITCPATAKMYLVKNSCAAAVTFTHGSGTTVSVGAGAIKWVATDGSDFFTAEEVDYLPLAGGTLTGALTLSGAPTVDLHAATKAYADTKLAKSGGTMTDFITLHADATDALHPVTLQQLNATALGSVSVSFAWADITGKPTTIAGYAITDAYTQTYIDANFQPLDGDLTSIAALGTTEYGRKGLIWNVRRVATGDSPVTVADGDMIICDSSGGAITLNLPAAGAGKRWAVKGGKSAETNNVTINPDGSDTILGEASLVIDKNMWAYDFAGTSGDWD